MASTTDDPPSWLRRPAVAVQPVPATPVLAPVPSVAAQRVAASAVGPAALASKGGESGEQMAVFQWAALNKNRHPELRWLYAIPNGGGRSARQGAILKAEGVKPGVSDICLPVARHGFHGLYIEMKKTKGVPSDVRTEQREFITFVTAQGYYAEVAFGWEMAIRILERYLLPLA